MHLQEEAKKKARAQRFNLPKSKAELEKEAKAKAAADAAEAAEKKRQRGERFGTLSEVCACASHTRATPEILRGASERLHAQWSPTPRAQGLF